MAWPVGPLPLGSLPLWLWLRACRNSSTARLPWHSIVPLLSFFVPDPACGWVLEEGIKASSIS
jgi:hypothetical protein